MTSRRSIYKSVLRSILLNKRTIFRGPERRIKEMIGGYIEENQCPVCGRRYGSRHGLYQHLIYSGHLEAIIDNILNARYLIWDYKSGDIIDPISGEIIERIYI